MCIAIEKIEWNTHASISSSDNADLSGHIRDLIEIEVFTHSCVFCISKGVSGDQSFCDFLYLIRSHLERRLKIFLQFLIGFCNRTQKLTRPASVKVISQSTNKDGQRKHPPVIYMAAYFTYEYTDLTCNRIET